MKQRSKVKERIQAAVSRSGARGPSPKGAYNICCPFCLVETGKADTKFKMELDPVNNLFYCHKCEAGGYADLSWIKRGTKPPQPQGEAESQDKPHGYYSVWSEGTSPAMLPYIRYLKRRGVTREQCRELQIGACVTGKYAGRIIVPQLKLEPGARGPSELSWSGFVARAIYDSMEVKYLYPKGMDRRNQIWGSWLPWAERTYIVEGVFDALALYPQAVATYGKNITDDQLELLAKLTSNEIVFAFDADAQQDGHVASMRLHALREWEYKGAGTVSNPQRIGWTELPCGKDPGDLGQDVRNFIEWL